jgi:type VI protein secretion system component VasK
MRTSPSPHASTPRPVLGHITVLALAGAAGLLAQLALGTGFTWVPRSPIAWGVILAVFALGEGFLHWFLRQAKRVAEEDVLFRGLGAEADRGRHRDSDRKDVATSERSTRR